MVHSFLFQSFSVHLLVELGRKEMLLSDFYTVPVASLWTLRQAECWLPCFCLYPQSRVCLQIHSLCISTWSKTVSLFCLCISETQVADLGGSKLVYARCLKLLAQQLPEPRRGPRHASLLLVCGGPVPVVNLAVRSKDVGDPVDESVLAALSVAVHSKFPPSPFLISIKGSCESVCLSFLNQVLPVSCRIHSLAIASGQVDFQLRHSSFLFLAFEHLSPSGLLICSQKSSTLKCT